jgi:CDP-diacylglycerol---glycerol-3-phosphate 3-phosphatidyltransferase
MSDAALYLPFAFLPGSAPLLLGIVIVLAVVSEYAGALAALIGARRRYDGPMGKSDRAFVFGVLGLLVGLGIDVTPAFVWVWAAMIALLVLTIAKRVRGGLSEVAQR